MRTASADLDELAAPWIQQGFDKAKAESRQLQKVDGASAGWLSLLSAAGYLGPGGGVIFIRLGGSKEEAREREY